MSDNDLQHSQMVFGQLVDVVVDVSDPVLLVVQFSRVHKLHVQFVGHQRLRQVPA